MHQRLANLGNLGIGLPEAMRLRYRLFLVLEAHSMLKTEQEEIRREIEHIIGRQYADEQELRKANQKLDELRHRSERLDREFHMRVPNVT